MLSQSRGLRFALVLLMSLGYVAWHGHAQVAYAEDDEEEGDDSGDEGDDGADSGDEGDGGDEGDEGDEEEPEEDQPPVTAGGLFTLKTYPVRVLSRPLTMTQGITELRFGIGTDLSNKGAFKTFGFNLDAIHGLKDNFSLIGGINDAYNFKQFNFYAGFEASLAYDVVDFRAALDINRPAIAEYCVPMGSPACDVDGMGMEVVQPTGKYNHGDTRASVDIGFPFRYVAKPEIAIVALNTLLAINFDGAPDLHPSLGIATNPIPALNVVIYASVLVPKFDFTKSDAISVPATARIQFSPNQKLDIGLEFTFLNVKPPEPQKLYDSRFLNLYAAARFGK